MFLRVQVMRIVSNVLSMLLMMYDKLRRKNDLYIIVLRFEIKYIIVFYFIFICTYTVDLIMFTTCIYISTFSLIFLCILLVS